MAKIIEVTPEAVEEAAKKIETLAGDYETQYNALAQKAHDLDAHWTGSDYQSFLAQIQEYQNALKHMKSLMDDFVAHCRLSAKSYRETQEDIAKKAKSLPTTY